MQKKYLTKIASPLAAAFGLVTPLVWKGGIQEIFLLVFKHQSGLRVMIFYAVLVTIMAVVVTILIGRTAEKTTGKRPKIVYEV